MQETPRINIIRAHELEAAVRERHEAGMRAAVAQAKRNVRRPFGAVIIDRDDGRVLAAAANAADQSQILHGETAAIDRCARDHPAVRWERAALYTTAEPCPMCAASIAWTGIGETVIGTSIEAIANLGIKQILLPCADVLAAAPFYRGRLVTDVLCDETDALYQAWADRIARGDG